MNCQFLKLVHRTHRDVLNQKPQLSEAERLDVQVGREYGTQLIDELRRGKRGLDFLNAAFILVGGSNPTILLGLLREIQDHIEGSTT